MNLCKHVNLLNPTGHYCMNCRDACMVFGWAVVTSGVKGQTVVTVTFEELTDGGKGQENSVSAVIDL